MWGYGTVQYGTCWLQDRQKPRGSALTLPGGRYGQHRQVCESGSRIKTFCDTFDVSEHSGHNYTGIAAVHHGALAAVSLLYCGCTNHVAPFPPSCSYRFPSPKLTALVVLACKNEQSIKTVAMLFSPADHAGSPSRPRIRRTMLDHLVAREYDTTACVICSRQSQRS